MTQTGSETVSTSSAGRNAGGDVPASRPGPSSVVRPYDDRQRGPSSLADVLDRVLDKGIVIAGDIQVNLLDIELLTIKIRLLVASVDKAKEMGIDWWEHDPMLSSGSDKLAEENRELKQRLAELEGREDPDG